MCVMAVVGLAPCQCFSPGGNQITSPGRICPTGPPMLCPAATSRDDESLTQRVGVPGCPRTRLKSGAGALNQCWIRRLKQRIDPHCASEPTLPDP
jgi:hypothetical protein